MHLKIFKYVFINVLLICFTNISYAQTYPVYKNSSAIAVLDQDALFSESEWGKKVLKNVEKKVSKLSDENRSIETALELEESELTKVRKTISKIEFDVLAIKFDEKVIVSSTGALNLEQVPKKMVVVGGGYIGLEMGSVWSRLGAEVQVVEFLDHITPGMDKEISSEFMKILKKQGMKFNMQNKVETIKKNAAGVVVSTVDKDGNKNNFECDVVLISVGRKPNTDGLNLESVGVDLDERNRIKTDKSFKTNVENIYAIGDVIVGPMLAHKAEDEGIAVAENIVGQSGHVNYDTIPGVVYTTPEVASIGKTEEQLKELNKKYKVGKFSFMANSRAKAIDDAEGFVKILADEKTDRILGAHLIGPHAGELIGEIGVAMAFGASAEDIARTCHAHPTFSEAVKEAALSVDKRAIHS